MKTAQELASAFVQTQQSPKSCLDDKDSAVRIACYPSDGRGLLIRFLAEQGDSFFQALNRMSAFELDLRLSYATSAISGNGGFIIDFDSLLNHTDFPVYMRSLGSIVEGLDDAAETERYKEW
jgi:hypothetical protein